MQTTEEEECTNSSSLYSLSFISPKSLTPLPETKKIRVHRITSIVFLFFALGWFLFSVMIKVIWAGIFFVMTALLGILANNRFWLMVEFISGIGALVTFIFFPFLYDLSRGQDGLRAYEDVDIRGNVADAFYYLPQNLPLYLPPSLLPLWVTFFVISAFLCLIVITQAFGCMHEETSFELLKKRKRKMLSNNTGQSKNKFFLEQGDPHHECLIGRSNIIGDKSCTKNKKVIRHFTHHSNSLRTRLFTTVLLLALPPFHHKFTNITGESDRCTTVGSKKGTLSGSF